MYDQLPSLLQLQEVDANIDQLEKEKAKMITSTLLGSFKEDPKTRNEFMELIRSERSAFWLGACNRSE